jgi:UDP-N-acetylglucosamine--N-acetylmuramyl-(pentapeptide) pyrophosphoryl-undecaprenol N-acetylglucosamine transferase
VIRRFGPDVVFGTGGYVMAPVGMAAVLRRKPLVMQVPDAIPGRAIRLLARRARVVCSAFEETGRRLPGAQVVVTGNPLRKEFAELGRGLRNGSPREITALQRLVIFGGSQGAHRLNIAVTEALKALLELDELDIHHLSGSQDFDHLNTLRSALPAAVRERYTVEAFNPDIVSVLNQADLVVSRAGGSIAELTALGLPMILVPYPYAGDHQRFNAEPVVAAGAGILVPDGELSGVRLFDEVSRLRERPQQLQRMAAASLSLGRPDAAKHVAQLVLEAAA